MSGWEPPALTTVNASCTWTNRHCDIDDLARREALWCPHDWTESVQVPSDADRTWSSRTWAQLFTDSLGDGDRATNPIPVHGNHSGYRPWSGTGGRRQHPAVRCGSRPRRTHRATWGDACRPPVEFLCQRLRIGGVDPQQAQRRIDELLVIAADSNAIYRHTPTVATCIAEIQLAT